MDGYCPYLVHLQISVMLTDRSLQGWYALRKEKRKLTAAFLFSGGLLFGLCIAGLASASFLWSLTSWWFFGTLYVISLISFAATLVLAIVCRRNFGNNLDHYRKSLALSTSSILSYKDYFLKLSSRADCPLWALHMASSRKMTSWTMCKRSRI